MGNDETVVPPTAEELAEEAEAQQGAAAKEEEIRAAIVEELELDEVEDAEKIDKLVKKEVAHRGKLSAAIGQKIKYRDLAGKKTETKEEKPTPKAPTQAEIDERVEKGVNSTLEKRDLEDMEYSEDIKKEIKRIAEIQGVSVKKAAKDPYIVSKIEAEEKAAAAEEASLSNKGEKKGTSKKNWDKDTPPDVDMSTPEGRKTYDEWKQWAISQGA